MNESFNVSYRERLSFLQVPVMIIVEISALSQPHTQASSKGRAFMFSFAMPDEYVYRCCTLACRRAEVSQARSARAVSIHRSG